MKIMKAKEAGPEAANVFGAETDIIKLELEDFKKEPKDL